MNLSAKLAESESRIRTLEQALEDERSSLRAVSLQDHGAVVEMQRAFGDEVSRRANLERRLVEVTGEKDGLKEQLIGFKAKLAKLDQEYLEAKEEHAKLSKRLGEDRTTRKQIEGALRLLEADKADLQARLLREQSASAGAAKKVQEMLTAVGQMSQVQKECSELKHALDRGKLRIASLESELQAVKTLSISEAESTLVKDLRSKLDKELDENIRLKDAYIIMKVCGCLYNSCDIYFMQLVFRRKMFAK